MYFELITSSFIMGLMLGGLYASVAVGLSLIFGIIRVINFAHGAFCDGHLIGHLFFPAFHHRPVCPAQGADGRAGSLRRDRDGKS